MIVHVLQALWQLPAALPIYVCYLWPFELLGLLKRDTVLGAPGGVITYAAHVDRWGPLAGLWRGWTGHGLPGAIVLRSSASGIRVWRHELRHVEQWQALGILWLPVYLLCLLRFGYRNNPFERDARATVRYE